MREGKRKIVEKNIDAFFSKKKQMKVGSEVSINIRFLRQVILIE